MANFPITEKPQFADTMEQIDPGHRHPLAVWSGRGPAGRRQVDHSRAILTRHLLPQIIIIVQ